jgi:predicted dehydrogenase
MEKVTVAQANALVIGAGISGERFTRALKGINSNTAIYDTDQSRAHRLAQSLNFQVAENLSDSMVAADIIYICTPIGTHFELAKQAILAGKPICCEKPLTGNLDQALTLQRMVHEKGTLFVTGNYYRLNCSILETKKAVEAGEIGKVAAIQATYLHDMTQYNIQTPWRQQEGFLYDGGIHPVDLACWIAGEPVREVSAISNAKEDFRFDLVFSSGLLAHIWLNARAQIPVHGAEVEILGTSGTIKAHNKDEFLSIFRSGSERFEQKSTPQGLSPIERVVTIMEELVSGKPDNFYPLPGIDDAINSIRILDAAEKSIETGLKIKL